MLLREQPEKFLDALDKHQRRMLERKLLKLKENPLRYVDSYRGEYYKFRMGDYRALLEIDFSLKIVRVSWLDHRRNIYK